jgi:hypothetical protein
MSLVQSKSSFIERRKITVKPDHRLSVNIYGRVFACTNASGPFMMNFNDGEFFPIKGRGVEWALIGEDRYARLQFQADVETNVEFYGGNFFWHENIVTPVIKVAATIIKPPTAVQIASLASIDLPGTGASGSGYGYRKSLIVTNLDPALDLDLLDELGNKIATVFYRQANVFETSADLTLKNNNGGAPMPIRIMEIFYPEEA